LKLPLPVYKNDVYGAAFGASALAADNVVRYAFSIAVPLFTIPMVRTLGFKWAIATFAFITLLLAPVPLILYLYGKRLRDRSPCMKLQQGAIGDRESVQRGTPLSVTEGVI
jgi:hypothetical protein